MIVPGWSLVRPEQNFAHELQGEFYPAPVDANLVWLRPNAFPGRFPGNPLGWLSITHTGSTVGSQPKTTSSRSKLGLYYIQHLVTAS